MRRSAPEEFSDDGDLFRWAEAQANPRDENTIREAWGRFHAKHPEVYEMFKRFALELIASGCDTLGAGAIWERMRWETSVMRPRAEGTTYALNNNYRAYYARLFMDDHPQHPEVFRTRKVRS